MISGTELSTYEPVALAPATAFGQWFKRHVTQVNISNDFMVLTPAKFPISLNSCYTHDI